MKRVRKKLAFLSQVVVVTIFSENSLGVCDVGKQFMETFLCM